MTKALSVIGSDFPTSPATIMYLHELFESQLERHANSPAISGAASLTYQEVEERSNRIANHLRQLGVGPGKLVGLLFNRSELPILAILGVLKAGGGYVPLDLSYPDDRMRYVLTEAEVGAVICEAKTRHRIDEVFEGSVLVLDEAADKLATQPSMEQRQKTRRSLRAIFAADITGFSGVMAAKETGTTGALDELRAIVNRQLQAHDGQLFVTPGDGVFALFESAVNAVRCALETQHQLISRAEAEAMRLRIGIHLGEVLFENDLPRGEALTIAARLEALADPGGILVSGAVMDAVASRISATFDERGVPRLKNIPRRIVTFAVRRARLSANATAEHRSPRVGSNSPWAAVQSGVPARVRRTPGAAAGRHRWHHGPESKSPLPPPERPDADETRVGMSMLDRTTQFDLETLRRVRDEHLAEQKEDRAAHNSNGAIIVDKRHTAHSEAINGNSVPTSQKPRPRPEDVPGVQTQLNGSAKTHIAPPAAPPAEDLRKPAVPKPPQRQSGQTPPPSVPATAVAEADSKSALLAETTEHRPSAECIESLTAALAVHLGPVAKVLVNRVLKQASSTEHLVSLLEEQIQSSEARFLFRIRALHICMTFADRQTDES
jgi:class 3 adenylate cyclase